MGKYIVYQIDGDGRFCGAEWIDALGDRFALQAARALAGPGGSEVWQLNRLVGRICDRTPLCASR